MVVKEVIEKLQTMDQDKELKILIYDRSYPIVNIFNLLGPVISPDLTDFDVIGYAEAQKFFNSRDTKIRK